MIIHFSCGATSAIAGALALKSCPDAEIIYADTGAEHEDNKRFLTDCERVLFKKKVTVLKHPDYVDLFDLFEKKEFLSGVRGAPCTTILKKETIRDYLGIRLLEEDHVYGYDTGEMERIDTYKKNNPEIKMILPLIEHHLSKANCLALLQRFDIELPAMYKLGYEHSNCIGCVKGGQSYWQAIKEDFPDVFDWFANHERKIGAKLEDGSRKGAAINKTNKGGERQRLFLDQWPEGIKAKRDVEISCGYSCGMVGDVIAGRKDVEDIADVDSVFGWMNK